MWAECTGVCPGAAQTVLYFSIDSKGGVRTKGREKRCFRLHINRVVDWSIKLWGLGLGTLATDGPHTKDMPDTIVILEKCTAEWMDGSTQV